MDSLERKFRIFQLRDQGLSPRQIARRVGVSGVAVWKILQGPRPYLPHADICSADVTFPGADYSEEEREWLRAAESYRELHHLKYMRGTDYLAMARSLGYRLVLVKKEVS